MTILSFTTDVAGQIGVKPRLCRILATDDLDAVSAAGFIKNSPSGVNNLEPTDVIHMIYSYQPTSGLGTFGIFRPYFSAGVITLIPWVDNADVLLPVVSGDFANFNGTTGQIKDSGFLPSDATKTKVVMASAAVLANHIACFSDTAGTVNDDSATAINGGNIQAGLSGTAGTLASFPSTAAKGSLQVVAVANTGDTATTISNAAMGQASVVSIPDPATATANFAIAPTALVNGNIVKASGTAGLVADGGLAANKLLTSGITTPDIEPNLVSFNVTVGQAALASAGHVALITSSGSKQYKIKQLQINSGGTNFSGGGGDRLGQVSDGTTVYSVVPAASLQTLANAQWGATALPNPASAAINTSTAAGANLYFAYSGGATDYTAGSVVISGLAERVA